MPCVATAHRIEEQKGVRIMKSVIERFWRTIVTFIITFVTESVNSVSDGIDEGNVKKVALHVTLLCSAVTVIIFSVYAFIKLAMRNMVTIVIVGFLAAAAYSAVQKLFQIEEPEPAHKPTEEDYQAGAVTIRPAVATVAKALGLAPIYSHTDMEADPEEKILPWGDVFCMKYKAPKKDVNAPIDTDMCQRVIQAQVRTVLYRDNPAGFTNIRFIWKGKSEPIIQIDKVLNGDAYIYIFVVISSAKYFEQRSKWENRKNAAPTEADTDDRDF